MTDVDGLARGFLAALRSNRPYDPPSARAPLALDEAYAVQRAFNELRAADDRIVGFKSAANADALQRALGLSEPIVGALFGGGERCAGCAIHRSDFRTLLIETEIGFSAHARIAAPLPNVDALRAVVVDWCPMIELADPGFGRTRMTGTDLVAANAASAAFIGGPVCTAAQIEPNGLRVRLERDGVALHEARGDDLMGDQWQALLWLVNRVTGLGYVIEPGQRLMTGALGPAQPAIPGRYLADFADVGALAFDVL